ncbi:MAG: ABC transporter permease [Verrucomicrobiota bacterium]|nr:ABC transporter permease [Verrucomicrobiota bacterium]
MIAAGVVLTGFGIAAIHLAHLRQNALLLDPVRRRAAIELPYDGAAMVIMLTTFLVGIFYCLDTLYGERRDRSILFWKSLPVSDLTAVLAKALVPLAILPLFTFVVVEGTQLAMLVVSSIALLPSGLSGTTWSNLPYCRMAVILGYALATMVLWQAPFYAWLLFVSSWARRAPFLWAVLPWLGACAVEKLAFNTTYLARMLGRRVFGNTEAAFAIVNYPHGTIVPTVDRLGQLDPVRFLTSPGLWLGFILAGAFLAGAIQFRRSRGPL